MEGSQLRCRRCGSVELTMRGSGYRCWGCGALADVRPTAAPSSRPPVEGTESAPRSFGPIVPPPGNPVQVPGSEVFVIPPTVSKEEAEFTAKKALGSFFRPPDIAQAEIAPLSLLYVPLWRVDVAVEGFHLGIRHSSGPDGRVHWVLPTGGFRHRDEIILLPARRFLPIDPTRKIKIRYDEMQPERDHPITDAEVIAPDIPMADATKEASERLRRKVQPNTALYARFEARIRSAVLCRYPLWVLRYRYRGEAVRRRGMEDCHIAVSARTGNIVSARHPSVFWSVAGKVRHFLLRGRQQEETRSHHDQV